MKENLKTYYNYAYLCVCLSVHMHNSMYIESGYTRWISNHGSGHLKDDLDIQIYFQPIDYFCQSSIMTTLPVGYEDQYTE